MLQRFEMSSLPRRETLGLAMLGNLLPECNLREDFAESGCVLWVATMTEKVPSPSESLASKEQRVSIACSYLFF